MPRSIHISIWGVLLFLLFTQLSFSQEQEYKFRHLTTEDGLPSMRTEYIFKDSRGFMWFGTNLGLCRYDGHNFKVYDYDPDDSTSVTQSTIKTNIIEDPNGYLWVGNYFGLNRFDPVTETFKRFVHDPDDSTSLTNNFLISLGMDHSGTIWVGMTSGGGLCRYNADKGNFTRFPYKPGETLNISAILEDRSGILWIATMKGLFQFDRQNELFIPIEPEPPLPDNFIPIYREIREDTKGNLWFVTQKAILTYKKTDGDSASLKAWLGEEKQFDDCEAKDILVEPVEGGQLLWLTACNLVRINTATWDFHVFRHDPNDSDSKGPGAFHLYKDDAGTLWISSRMSGINILDKDSYQIVEHNDFYRKYGCNATIFFEHSDGSIWVGTHANGIMHFDPQMNMLKWYKELYIDKTGKNHAGLIRTMAEDHEGRLWVGDYSSGVYYYDKSKDQFVHCDLEYLNPEKNTIAVNHIFEDSDRIIWVGTQSGLYKKDEDAESLELFSFFPISDPAWRPVNYIYEDSEGWLWFCGNGTGLYCQTPDLRRTDIFKNYSHEQKNKNSIGSNNVWKISEDDRGNLWVSTYHGLNVYDRETDSFKRIWFEKNPASNYINDFVEDNRGYFWLVSSYGLLRFKLPTDTGQNSIQPEIRQFLPFSDIFSKKISMLSDGKILIGGNYSSENGYFSFQPDSIQDNKRIPPIVITNFQLNNKTASLDTSIILKKHIVLNHDQNFFSFEFSALDYINSEENNYAYYLDGFEEEWIYSGNRRKAFYTGVPPGEYIFRAKGSNNDGYWNEAGVAIGITILPPPWKTWWAYILYGLFVALVFYIIIRYYLKRQKLLHNLAIEHIEAEKLKELDSMKSRFFANISHEFRTPLTLILGPLDKLRSKVSDQEGTQDLNIMQRNAVRLQNLINQLLSLSKLESGQMKLQAFETNLVKLVNGYVQSFESLAKQKNIDLAIKAEKLDIQAYIDQEKLEKILYNLLSNAFKFTPEGGVIKVEVGSGQFAVGNTQKLTNSPVHNGITAPLHHCTIVVSDTGPGISPDHLTRIFDRFYQADDTYTKNQEGTGIGLALTKELVELHHGKITVESEVGKGTTFTVILPLGKVHLKTNETIAPPLAPPQQGRGVSPLQEVWGQDPASCIEQPSYPSPDLPGSQDRLFPTRDGNKTPSGGLGVANEKPVLLIVEDNTDLRAYIRSYLIKSFHVLEASNGKKGLEKAIEQVPDLVVSDVMMPEMDGFELCEKLKTDERTSHIPVILLTARTGTESRIEGLETGADDFITKPFEADELLVRIRNLIVLREKLQDRFMKNIRKVGVDHLMDIETPDLTSFDQQFLKKAVSLVLEKISNPDLNVEWLSSELAVSIRQLQRKMVAITGDSPGKFIRTIRLNRAAELLVNKTGNVTEIAFDVGFNNLSYFAKSFRDQFGVLPSQYPE